MISDVSTPALGLGQRMRAVRMERKLIQPDVAVRLGIANKTYKMYELEQRAMPFPVAVNFAQMFELDLNWLATGEGPRVLLSEPELTASVAEAVIAALGDKIQTLTPELVGTHIAYVRDQCVSKGESPEAAAATLMKLLPK